jgi:hypothetical protein
MDVEIPTDVEIVSDRQVLHRATTESDVITRVQVVRVERRFEEVQFWHNMASGKLVRVTSHEVRA